MADFGNADRRRSGAHPDDDRTARRYRGRDSSDDGDRLAALRAELDEKEARIAELEAELARARDFEQLAESFVDALAEHRRASDRARSDRGNEHESVDSGADEQTDDAFAAFGAMMDDDDAEDTDSTEASNTADGLAALAGIGDDAAGPATNGDEAANTGWDSADAATIADGGLTVRSISTEIAEFEDGVELAGPEEGSPPSTDGRPGVVVAIENALEDLDETGRAMLARYRTGGPQEPEDVYQAVTGESDRPAAYERNRALRRAGLVEHVGQGHYEYALPSRLAAGCASDDGRSGSTYARDLEQRYLD